MGRHGSTVLRRTGKSGWGLYLRRRKPRGQDVTTMGERLGAHFKNEGADYGESNMLAGVGKSAFPVLARCTRGFVGPYRTGEPREGGHPRGA